MSDPSINHMLDNGSSTKSHSMDVIKSFLGQGCYLNFTGNEKPGHSRDAICSQQLSSLPFYIDNGMCVLRFHEL